MSRLKQKDIEKLSTNELSIKLFELKKELMKENTQIAIGTVPKNPGNIKVLKKNIAVIIDSLNKSQKRGGKEE